MDSSHDVRRKRRRNKFTALFGNSKLWPEQGLGGGRTEGNDDVRFDERDLGVEPGTAGSYFQGVGVLVDPAFAAWFPFEMFDHVGDVGLLAIDAGRFQCIVEQTSGGTDKWSA